MTRASSPVNSLDSIEKYSLTQQAQESLHHARVKLFAAKPNPRASSTSLRLAAANRTAQHTLILENDLDKGIEFCQLIDIEATHKWVLPTS